MKDISIFFQPVYLEEKYSQDSLGDKLIVHTENNFPELSNSGIALFHVPEYRNCEGKLKENEDEKFRNHLYKLFVGANWKKNIYDLGNILPGETIADTYLALSEVTKELVQNNFIVIVVGGTQDLTVAQYRAYSKLEQLVNLASVDSKFDLGSEEEKIVPNGWLTSIVLEKPCFLFNYSNISAQNHYIPPKEIELFEKLYFDSIRLGQLTNDLSLCEPILRNSDILSLDLTAIKASDFGGDYYTQPNGLSSNETCRIGRYAGISDKLSSIGIYNYFPQYTTDKGDQLVAQLIWYFIEGVELRKGDFPVGTKKNYSKYHVFNEEVNSEILFYKSDKSSRWWMEVPYPAQKGIKYERHHLVPCTYYDYEEAMKGVLPDLWWKTFQKL